jgi:hypothetical protein
MKQSTGQVVYWTPRVLSVLFVIFLAMMSLDVFEQGGGFWQIALGLFVHNIPALILLAVVIVAWRYEIVGAAVFLFGGIVYAVLVLRNPFEWYYLAWIVQISGMAFLISALFFIGWRKKQHKENPHNLAE